MNRYEFVSSQPWVTRLGWTLIHFLWQGTLIAAMYSLARRSRTVQSRYVLACIALAAMVAATIITYSLSAPESAAANDFTTSVPVSSVPANQSVSALAVMSRTSYDDVMPWIAMAWFAGAIVFWTRLTGGWIVAARMKSNSVRPAPADWQQTLDEIKTRISISRPVKLLVSALVQVPSVIGWLRPVVLVPVGALAGLTADQIEALLAHELAHIRRYDYLVNIMQGVAEALLFYHPAVWWISNEIRNTRELCCDDIAVGISGNAVSYACALANLEARCSACFSPALAANGGSLAFRVSRLLGIPPSKPASEPGIIVAAGLILMAALVAFAQPALSAPEFEVASVKPSPPEYVGFQSYVKGDRYTAMTATLRDLVGFAYSIRGFQISGGPAWSASATYNIDAKMDPVAAADQSKLMLQKLLADRFNLKFHRVIKNRSGYALVVDKNGLKLTESKQPGPGLGGGKSSLNGRGCDMRTLAMVLSSRLENPVADRTGLKALYDFTVNWTPEEENADAPGVSMFTALREQLGLRLDPVKNVPVAILIIDHADRPTEN